ncbi:MAG TPA: glycosyltransferase [Candidatus Saccharimonadales bacterium]|nr:glycosyltransferase [Candidatus Saccharimonadales bacterium]
MERILLHVGGSGRDIPGFLRVGPGAGPASDAVDGLPFPSGAVAGIYCESFLERLEVPQAMRFLRECRRVLAAGGTLRVVTPDLDHAVRTYRGDWRKQAWLREPGQGWITRRGAMLNQLLRGDGRRWVYSEEELVELAGWAGLGAARRRPPGESGVPGFEGLEPAARPEAGRGDLILEVSPACRPESAEPLVSVLIPAYNPAWFEAALHSALGQSYRRLEVVVCDDSSDGRIQQATARAAAADLRVRYERNEPRRGGYENFVHCFHVARGEYVKFLADDDLLRPECLERMVRVLAARPTVTLVTSHRRRIGPAGEALEDVPATARPVPGDSLLDGIGAAGLILSECLNFVGEPSTALFRRADLEDAGPTPLCFAGRPVHWNVDVAMWAHLLGKGDLVYLVDTLSCFRQHDAQQTLVPQSERWSVANWEQMRADALRLGFPIPCARTEVLVRPLAAVPEKPGEWPSAARALHAYGLEMHGRQRFPQAADALRRAAALEPQFALAHLHLGLCLYALGDFPGAASSLARAMELEPQVPEPVRQLAESLRRQGAGGRAGVPSPAV